MAISQVPSSLADVERKHILATLRACGSNRTRAAKMLDISVRCLRNKLREYRNVGVEFPEQHFHGTRTAVAETRPLFREEMPLPLCF
jgi:transposase